MTPRHFSSDQSNAGFEALILMVVVLGGYLTTAPGLAAPDLVVTALGAHQTTIGSGGAGGLQYFADIPVQIIERQQRGGTFWMRCLITAGNSVALTQKSSASQSVAYDMANQWKQAVVLSPGTDGYDHSYAGIGGSWWVEENGQTNLYVWYHGEDQDPALPKLPGNVNGYYSSICAARSTDGGASFTKLGQCLTSAPKNTTASAPGDQGDGECSVTPDKTGQYLLCYYSDHYGKQVGRGVQICVARSPRSSKGSPGSWQKYYNGSFQTAGLGGSNATPVVSSAFGCDAIFPMVQWVAVLNRYVMIYCENVYTEFTSPGYAVNSGIYMAYSSDGISWTGRTNLTKELTIPWTGKRIAVHPTLDFSTTNANSASGKLYYGYSENWPTPAHYLCGRDITVLFNAVLTSVTVSPSSGNVPFGGTQQFAATGKDQDGNALSPQPAFNWAVNGGGTISTNGLFTAGNAAGGPYTVTASSGGRNGTASVRVLSSYQWTATADQGGTITGSTNGMYISGSNVTVAATPPQYYHWGWWSGDVPAAQTNANPLTLVMDRARAVTAHFTENLATNGAPEWWLHAYYPASNNFDAVALSDTDGDGLQAWQEYLAGTNPTNLDSVFRITSIARMDHDLLIHWRTGGGRTNVVAVTSSLGGSFSNISPGIILPGAGDICTNFLHAGGATSSPVWFYRIQTGP
jgi:hypothetical protein